MVPSMPIYVNLIWLSIRDSGQRLSFLSNLKDYDDVQLSSSNRDGNGNHGCEHSNVRLSG